MKPRILFGVLGLLLFSTGLAVAQSTTQSTTQSTDDHSSQGPTLAEGEGETTPLRYLSDWKWEGPAAPILMAQDKGFFSAEGLDVTLNPGAGSVEGITRVDAGEYDVASVDINSLIRFLDENPDSDLHAVYVIYNTPPFAIIGRPSQGVVGPSNLEGKILGAPAADATFAQWGAFTKVYPFHDEDVTITEVSFAEREQKLADGEVDAITGYSYTSLINLQAIGVPDYDISLMLMSDFGLEVYGNVLIVNPAYAAENPEAVKGFLRAITRGYQDTIAFPADAIQYVLAHNSDADAAIELTRLIRAIGFHIVNSEVRENGLGSIDVARLERSIEQLSQSYDFTNRPEASDIFDVHYLPGKSLRNLPEPDAAAQAPAEPPPADSIIMGTPATEDDADPVVEATGSDEEADPEAQ